MTRWMRISFVLGALLGGIAAPGSDALSTDRFQPHFAFGSHALSFDRHWRSPHFVPNSQRFWDNSKNWTTNYGPAYRDTIDGLQTIVPCTGRYALCFESGPEPLPCKLDRSGRFANCTCTVQEGINYVLISGILNYRVYLETIDECGIDGSGCFGVPDKAPVCKAIAEGRLIRGAQVISTFSREARSNFATALSDGPDALDVTLCPKGPYAGCMTAPCKETGSGEAVCSCPVFWGPFQLYQADSQCTLDPGLVNSSSYSPALDRLLGETSAVTGP